MSNFLKTHERLILVIFGLSVLLWLGNKYLNHSSDVANAKSTAAQEVVQQQVTVNNQLAEQVKQATVQYQQLSQQVASQNQQLLAAIATRTQNTQVQQKADQTLAVPALADRWEDLAGLQSTDVTPTASGVQVTDAGSRLTVQNLEKIPELEQNLVDTQKLASNFQEQVASCQKVNTDLTSQVSGLNKQISEMQTSCKAQIAAVKADERKSKLHYFLTGVGIGAGIVVAAVAHIF